MKAITRYITVAYRTEFKGNKRLKNTFTQLTAPILLGVDRESVLLGKVKNNMTRQNMSTF